MNDSVYVVTSTELGWDCVIGIFWADSVTHEELEKEFNPEEGYVVHYQRPVQSKI